MPYITRIILCLLFFITGCHHEKVIPSATVLKQKAEEALQKKKYKQAGEHFFDLWCYYPDADARALLSAAKSFTCAGEHAKAIDLAEDYITFKGDNDGEIYFIKALAYYNQALSPLKDNEKAEFALLNLNLYKDKRKKNGGIVENQTEVKKMESFLHELIASGRLSDADICMRANPPSYISAMNIAQDVMTISPNSDEAEHAKKIWMVSAANLKIRDIKDLQADGIKIRIINT